MAGRDRTETAVVLALWVLPLAVVVWLLVLADLPRLAVALVAVEVVVGGAVALARRRPAGSPRPSRPWVVPAAMVGLLVALVGLSALVAQLG